MTPAEIHTSTNGRVASRTRHSCPVCGSVSLQTIFRTDKAPVLCNVLNPTRSSAVRMPRGELDILCCRDCLHVFNGAFDARLLDYEGRYENSLGHSPKFRRYLRSLADELVANHRLVESTVVEVGCGDGQFLRMLCDAGNNRGFGFDPSAEAGVEDCGERIQFRRAQYDGIPDAFEIDFLCSRHVLEHLESPADFLASITAVRPHGFYFEVPNGSWVLRAVSIWDLIFEHFSYFVPSSLQRLFEVCGFDESVVQARFDSQFMSIENAAAQGPSHDSQETSFDQMAEAIDRFGLTAQAKIDFWRERLAAWRHEGLRTVIWGVGSKGTMFLNLCDELESVEYAVDVNPKKQGMWVTGSGQAIVAPERLPEIRPDRVVLMNRVYESEVRSMLNRLSVSAELHWA